jgi:hypothetical protein
MASNIGQAWRDKEWVRRRLRQEESVARPQFDASSNGSEVGRDTESRRWPLFVLDECKRGVGFSDHVGRSGGRRLRPITQA